MATFTANKGYPQPIVGGDTGQWGTEWNQGTSTMDNNMGGTATIPFTNTSVTASFAQYQCLIQNCTGVLTANVSLILPAVGGFYGILNNTTGPFFLTVTCAGGGASVTVRQGAQQWVFCDGTNIFPASGYSWQELGSYNLSGLSVIPFLLPNYFRRFRVTLQGLTHSAGAAAFTQFQWSTNAGSSLVNTGYTVVSLVAEGATISTTTQATGAVQLTGNGSNWDSTTDLFPGVGAQAIAKSFQFGFAQNTNRWTLVERGGNVNLGAIGNAGVITIAGGGTWSAGTGLLEGLP